MKIIRGALLASLLALPGTDHYDIYTKAPLTGIDDIDGMKLSAPGVLGNWLRGTGANARAGRSSRTGLGQIGAGFVRRKHDGCLAG